MDDETIDQVETIETMAATAPPDDEPGVRRHRRARVVLVIGAGLLLVAAAVVGGLGVRARSEASDQRAAATTATHRRITLSTRRLDVVARYTDVKQITDAAPLTFETLGRTIGDLADAQNHFVAVTNHGVELFNQGDEADAVAVYRTDGAAALDDMTTKDTAAMQALQAARDALRELQEAQ